ncbi:hypothetical protein GTO27_04910 [Candidatus Bathyarchaeota archaeon]|nr:hypothetical protein [Candidatus Bathyarchaeota archaeon]
MTSRTYRTCERIMAAVVHAGFLKQISWPALKKVIKRVAGGDRRTVNAYREHLVDFEFLQELQTDVVPVFEIDLMKLPYAQTRLDERIRVEKRVIVEP